MKKMKTKATALLLLAMMLFTMVGCSQAELGYLELSKQMEDMQTVQIDEVIAIDLSGHKLDALTGLELGNHLDIRATGKMDMKTMAFDLELAYRTGTTGAFQPVTRMAMDKDVMYMSTEGIWKLIKQYAGEKFSPEYIAEMDAYITANPFVKVDASAEEGMDMDAYYEETMKWSYGVLDILTKYHEGFTTDLITEKDGGYEINMTGDDVIKVTDGWLAYLQNDTANSYAMVNEIFTSMQDMMKAGGVDMSELALTEKDWQESLTAFNALWSQLKAELAKNPISDKDYYKGFYKMTGDKGSRVVEGSSEINIDELGLKMTAKATTTEIKGVVAPSFNATDADAFTAGIDEINARYTVLESVALQPVDESSAVANITMSFCGQPSTRGSYAEMQYINDRYYISTDTLANVLPGAVVDVTDTQATVTFNGRSAGMAVVMATDVLDEEAAFVALRDLAQLGLDIEYAANPEALTLTVQK